MWSQVRILPRLLLVILTAYLPMKREEVPVKTRLMWTARLMAAQLLPFPVVLGAFFILGVGRGVLAFMLCIIWMYLETVNYCNWYRDNIDE